ncbi:tryptophan--tRNA ligase, mitochondrial-like [Homarus americanus]|nr:tryptophan--tRNA ligase, mitochondrial-like [Homarus americanus]
MWPGRFLAALLQKAGHASALPRPMSLAHSAGSGHPRTRRCFSSTVNRQCEPNDSLNRRVEDSHTRKTIFSGIQPTGVLHLGNYFGAVQRWVELQETGEEVIFCIVDLHSITLPQDPKTLHSQIITMAASLVACGIDPSRAVLFQQSRVSEHAQFNWVLGCLTTMARLGHLPQYKEKSASLKEIPLGLYVYPVLQSADILLYRATHVPVGEDQRQHIQLAAHLARVFNNKFGQTFVLPRSLVYDDSIARVKSLRQPDKKMSKSETDPKSRINLADSPDEIREKFKKAVTDFTSAVYFDAENRPGVSNLMSIHRAVTGQSMEQISRECEGVNTAQYKLLVADAVIEHLRPIRLRLEQLLSDRAHLNHLLDLGADKAKTIASKTWQDVREKVGLLHK